MKTLVLLLSLLGLFIATEVHGGYARDDGDDVYNKYGCDDEPCLINLEPALPSLQRNVPFKPNVYRLPLQNTPTVKCEACKYRSINGTCNNVKHPNFGKTNSTYARLLSPDYADGIHEPPKSVLGGPLPLARLISTTVYPDKNISDPEWTLVTMTWGQFISHDLSLAIAVTQITGENPVCCGNGSTPLSKACLPMYIPKNDYFYEQYNQTCLNFIRSATDVDINKNPGNKPAEQISGATSWMDASHIYGSEISVADSLRQFSGGKLRVNVRNKRQYPPDVPNKPATCFITKPEEVCYLFGDNRGVQNPQLTSLQVLFVREHNRIADELSKINPDWNDETLFQETRRIVIAEYQYISYYEWLPILFGKRLLLKTKIIYKTDDYVDDYDDNMDPSIFNEFATAAYRFQHSAIQGMLALVSEPRNTIKSTPLSDWYVKPSILEENDNLDNFVRGLATQHQHAMDEYHTVQQTNLLFKFGAPFGGDLKATDVQRSRDHGLGTYNDMRELCGFPRAKKFSDFNDLIPQAQISKLASLYKSPDDVELTVGGSLEKKAVGALMGPTLSCVVLDQFYRTRIADPYFFETGQPKHAFTRAQLKEIRKTTVARILCDNSDNVWSMQPMAFRKLSAANPIIPCSNYAAIPAMDLRKWKE